MASQQLRYRGQALIGLGPGRTEARYTVTVNTVASYVITPGIAVSHRKRIPIIPFPLVGSTSGSRRHASTETFIDGDHSTRRLVGRGE